MTSHVLFLLAGVLLAFLASVLLYLAAYQQRLFPMRQPLLPCLGGGLLALVLSIVGFWRVVSLPVAFFMSALWLMIILSLGPFLVALLMREQKRS